MAGRNRLPIIIPLLECKDEVQLDELDEHILLLEAARHHLDVEWTESLGEFEARDGHDVFGYASLVAYLKDRTRMAGSRANRYVSIARMARRFGATLSSWKHRQIQSDQAEQLFKAAERMPDRYPEAESVLLEIAGDLRTRRARCWITGRTRTSEAIPAWLISWPDADSTIGGRRTGCSRASSS